MKLLSHFQMLVLKGFVFFFLLRHCCLAVGVKNEVDKSQALFEAEPDLFLTVSSEPDCPKRSWYKPWTWFTETKCDRRLELNWINFDKIFVEDNHVHDYIGVFKWDPSSKSSPQPPTTPPDDHRCPIKSRLEAASGYYKTTMRYEISPMLSPGGLKNPCFLGYWIAYVRITEKLNDSSNDNSTNTTSSESFKTAAVVVKSKCLRLNPFWMTELQSIIGDLPLTLLMIPGTHNSGSWESYKGLLKSEINPFSSYNIAQEESIHNQLMHGIRYLDVRVTYRSFLPEKFWVSHDSIIRQIPLTELLEDIQRFHEETNRGEIVFVDFHQVTLQYSLSSKVNRAEEDAHIHNDLILLVQQYLGQYLVPYKTNTSLTSFASLSPNQLWKWGKTVLVTYPEPEIQKQYSFLWPRFQHSWANTNNVSELEKFLSEELQYYGCQGRYWTLMAELTATTQDVILKPELGLRGMAQAVNGRVTKWFQRHDWHSRTMVVASDYFLGNNLIEIAIKVNMNGGTCRKK